MIRPRWRWLLPCLLLSACARAPLPSAGGQPWQAPAWQDWRLEGRIGVRAEGEGWHGRFRWIQGSAGFDLRLWGPLGQGAMHLQGWPGGSSLTLADGRRWQGRAVARRLRARLGVVLPLRELGDWVRGRPAPGEPARVERAADGRPRRLVQAGWTVDYAAYQRFSGVERLLPRRLLLSAGRVRVRLVLDHWSVPGGGRPAP